MNKLKGRTFLNYDELTPEEKEVRKKQLGAVGAGLTTIGALTTAGHFAYKKLEKNVREGKAKTGPNPKFKGRFLKLGLPMTAAGLTALGLRKYHIDKEKRKKENANN